MNSRFNATFLIHHQIFSLADSPCSAPRTGLLISTPSTLSKALDDWKDVDVSLVIVDNGQLYIGDDDDDDEEKAAMEKVMAWFKQRSNPNR
jgi:hypothetical protein